MMDWVKRFFGSTGSSTAAKERLRLVLMTDHLALAPEMIEAMKRDLVDVISRYVEVDREKVEVNFEREDRALAMLANIPIKSVNRPQPEPVVAAETVTPTPAPAATAPKDGAPPTRPRRRRKKSAPASPAVAR
ncbi:MAG: cell division topological specificity factor MinE [Candidatus Baltobacteraceae bacterium]